MAWYNDLLGGVHLVGGAVATVFGAGAAVPYMEELEGDALPAWARTRKSPAPVALPSGAKPGLVSSPPAVRRRRS